MNFFYKVVYLSISILGIQYSSAHDQCGDALIPEEFGIVAGLNETKPACDKNFDNIELLVRESGSYRQLSPKDQFGKRVYVTFHEVYEDPAMPQIVEMVDALESLKHENKLNLIVLNYTNFVMCNYYEAQNLANELGQAMAEKLCGLSNVDPNSLYLIGLGIGTLFAGATGRRIKSHCDVQVRDILALNVPILGNLTKDDVRMLQKSDATLVRSVYTTKDSIAVPYTTGHQNFFFGCNGTTIQPGCEDAEFPTGCSQFCPYYLIAAAIKESQNIYAIPCKRYEDFVDGLCQQSQQLKFGIEPFSSKSHPDSYYIDGHVCPPFNYKKVVSERDY